jgi:hypothetical protein
MFEMFEGHEGKLFLCILLLTGCLILAVPFIYLSEQSDIANMLSRCESRSGALLKNTYRVGKTSNTTWVCVKPEIIIEI